jgi:hypothetical protein
VTLTTLSASSPYNPVVCLVLRLVLIKNHFKISATTVAFSEMYSKPLISTYRSSLKLAFLLSSYALSCSAFHCEFMNQARDSIDITAAHQSTSYIYLCSAFSRRLVLHQKQTKATSPIVLHRSGKAAHQSDMRTLALELCKEDVREQYARRRYSNSIFSHVEPSEKSNDMAKSIPEGC